MLTKMVVAHREDQEEEYSKWESTGVVYSINKYINTSEKQESKQGVNEKDKISTHKYVNRRR